MGIDAPPLSNNVGLATAFPSSTFSTSSTSYVDLLDGSGGDPISVALNKVFPSTSVLVLAGADFETSSGNTTWWVGVNDGTTDHDVGRTRMIANNHGGCAAGRVILTGLPVGALTLTLRTKRSSGSASVRLGANGNAYLLAWEVAT